MQQRAILDGTPSTLAGIIFLHRISSPRFAGSSVSAVSALRRLCDAQASTSQIKVLTTFWDAVEESEGRRREAELRNMPMLLKDLLDNGSTLQRAPDSKSGKKDVIATLLEIRDEDYDLSWISETIPGAFPKFSDQPTKTTLPFHLSNNGASTGSIPLDDRRPPTPLPQLFELERATLAIREAALKSREGMLQIRENDLLKELERQRLAAAGEQARLQQKFEARLDEERASFAIALAAERKQRDELDEQIQAFKHLLEKRVRLSAAKDKELADMAEVVSDTIAFSERRRQAQLHQIGAVHETDLYFHMYQDLVEISSAFMSTHVMATMVAAIKAEESGDDFDKSPIVAQLTSQDKEIVATEADFHIIRPCCDPIAYLTNCSWKGFEWASQATDLGSTTRGIRFRVDCGSQPHLGLYQVQGKGGRDSHGSFTLSGTFDVSQAHDNGRMTLWGMKQYADRAYPFELRAIPRGLAGVCDEEGDGQKVKAFWGAKHYLEDNSMQRRYIRLWKEL